MLALVHASGAGPSGGGGEGPLLADYREHHTDVSVHFDVELVPGKMAAALAAPGGLAAKFKLASKISTGAVLLWLSVIAAVRGVLG